jgi:hypothetical protein
MYNKNKSVYLDSRGHANLDSFPLRYGVHYPYSKTLELYDCTNWIKDQKFSDRHHVDAKFLGKDNQEDFGHFVLAESQFDNMKIVTVWKHDMEVEYKLSNWLRFLREGNNISVQDLLEFHPYYENGTATSFEEIYKLLLDRDVKKITNKKLENVAKDFKKELEAKQEELTDLLKIKLELSNINNQLSNDLDKAKIKIKEFEQDKFKEESKKAQSQNGEKVVVTLGEKLLLIKVNDVIHKGSNCTELEFSNGERQWMKKRTFDKFGIVTQKAKSLINEAVITSSWNPKSNPTLWKKQGYFRNIYKAN